jgi:leucyl-tRNA synthetase
VVCAVQVEGKVRARLDVDPAVGDEELRARALADPAVIRALAGRAVRTVVIRAPKLVNIVTA